MKMSKPVVKTTIVLCALLGLSACKLTEKKDTPLKAGEARYSVTFTGNWSKDQFPKNYPSNAHFSPMVLVSHSNQVKFWDMGQPATKGVESLAETGQTNLFVQEINQQKSNGKAQNHFILQGLETGTRKSSGTVIVSPNFPQVTALSMLAPSPDWIVGVDGIDLFETNEWVTTRKIDLLVYDAGTEEGERFSLDNPSTQTGVIQKLTTNQINTDFNQGKHRNGAYVATLTFRLVEQK